MRLLLISLFASSALALAGCPDEETTPTPDADATIDTQPDTPEGDADATEGDADTTEGDADAGPDDVDAVEDAETTEGDVDAIEDAETTEGDVDAIEDAETTEGDVDAIEDAETTGDADDDTEVVDPTCTSACDCPQGQDCVAGACTLGTSAVLCCTQAGCVADQACVNADGTDGLCGVTNSADYGALVFNEVLTDGEVDGDPNGDGDTNDAVGDEFVELVNVSGAAVDISGWTLLESGFTLARHTFGASTSVPDGHAVVVFGGGTAPDDTATATFVVANAEDPGISFGLSLDNQGDTVRLLDANGDLVALFVYGEGTGLPAIGDESFTRDPDTTGDFVGHSAAAGAAGALFSPGTRTDGSDF